MFNRSFRIYCTLLFFFFYFSSSSQNSRFTVNNAVADDFFEKVKSYSLIVPLDENERENKALKEAVRKYWKHSPYKFITKKEFQAVQDKNDPNEKKMYLIRETYERLKYKRKEWAYTKYYLSTENGGVEVLNSPYVEFKVPVRSEDKHVVLADCSFLYGLMMKQMNYDFTLMQNMTTYKAISRKSLLKSKFSAPHLKPYTAKTLLVSRIDFQNYVMNLPDRKKTPDRERAFLHFISKKAHFPIDKIKMDTEENITKAVSSSDKNTLVYTGYSIYNAENGELLKRIDPNSGKRKRKAFTTVIVAGVLIAAGVFFLTS